MANVLFTNVRIIDGSGAQPYSGEVLVQGNRIARVARGVRAIATAGITVIDAAGATLMPGMTEAHTHFSWNDQPGLNAIQRMPPEEHILWCAHIAERYLAASQEITVPGGLGDETLPHLPFPEFSFGVVVNGVEEMRAAVRRFLKYGVDAIKLNLSGEYIAGIPAEFTPMTDAEVAVAVEEAKLRGKRVQAHARSCESIKQCLRHGIEVIYHASFTDEEALDMLEAAKDRIFVAPGLAWLVKTSYHAAEWGLPPEVTAKMGYHRELETAIESLKKMHKRGVKILPGGDYGFAWIPHGSNATDLEYFVKYLGFTPMEAIVAATRLGGEIMMQPRELGLVKEGYLADLLLVDGDPLANIALLQDKDRILAVMKDGTFHKQPDIRSARSVMPASVA